MKIIESLSDWTARREQEISPKAKDPAKVLDLLIHLDSIGVQKFKDIDFVETSDYDEVILDTSWGKVLLDYSEDLDHQPTGEGDFDSYMLYTFNGPQNVYKLTMKVHTRGKSGDHDILGYANVDEIVKEPVK